MENFESPVNKNELIQKNVEAMVDRSGSIEEVIMMLKGLALGVEKHLYDPETGNNLPIERVIGALKGDKSARADECPLWLNRALNQKGF